MGTSEQEVSGRTEKKRDGLGTVWLSYLNFCLVKACQHQLFYSFAQNTDGALTTQFSKQFHVSCSKESKVSSIVIVSI